MWGPTEELLATMIEEVALLASDRRRKDPLTIPRPYDAKPAPQPAAGSLPAQPDAGAGPASVGHLSMFAALSDRLQVVVTPPEPGDG